MSILKKIHNIRWHDYTHITSVNRNLTIYPPHLHMLYVHLTQSNNPQHTDETHKIFYKNPFYNSYKIDERIIKNIVHNSFNFINTDEKLELIICYNSFLTSNLICKNDKCPNPHISGGFGIYCVTERQWNLMFLVMPENWIKFHRNSGLHQNYVKFLRNSVLPQNWIKFRWNSGSWNKDWVKFHRNSGMPQDWVKFYRNSDIHQNWVKFHRNSVMP